MLLKKSRELKRYCNRKASKTISVKYVENNNNNNADYDDVDDDDDDDNNDEDYINNLV